MAIDYKHLLEVNAPAVVFTGAGISEESGIPTFRSASGLWKKYNPDEYGTLEAFKRNPTKCWEMFREVTKSCLQAEPNEAHKMLAQLQKKRLVGDIITQNVDGLHQKAGSNRVIEIHGSLKEMQCIRCDSPDLIKGTFPPKCSSCGSIMKPAITLFGEQMPWSFEIALDIVHSCKMMIIVGTSGLVEPASMIPSVATMMGVPVVEINPEPAGLGQPHLWIAEKATEGLKRFL